MPVLRFLSGLRRFGAADVHVSGNTVGSALLQSPLPAGVLLPTGRLHPDIEVLVNGRNIAFLAGLDTRLDEDDRVTVFFNGARGYPGG